MQDWVFTKHCGLEWLKVGARSRKRLNSFVVISFFEIGWNWRFSRCGLMLSSDSLRSSRNSWVLDTVIACESSRGIFSWTDILTCVFFDEVFTSLRLYIFPLKSTFDIIRVGFTSFMHFVCSWTQSWTVILEPSYFTNHNWFHLSVIDIILSVEWFLNSFACIKSENWGQKPIGNARWMHRVLLRTSIHESSSESRISGSTSLKFAFYPKLTIVGLITAWSRRAFFRYFHLSTGLIELFLNI